MFNDLQQKEIDIGQQAGLDTSLYAFEDYDSLKMRSIRCGLEKKVDIKRFPLEEFNSRQIDEIVLGLQANVEVDLYADSKYNADQMFQIRRGMESKVDVSVYTNPSFDYRQMAEIRWSLKQGIDISNYAKPYVTADRMAQERRIIANQSISEKEKKVERVKMWQGNPHILEKKFDIYVNKEKDIKNEQFLNWNKKIEQSILDNVSKTLKLNGYCGLNNNSSIISGYNLYNIVSTTVGSDDKASQIFIESGILGMTYGKEGEQIKYVVFDSNLEIKDKLGLEKVEDKRLLRNEADRKEIINKIKELHSYSEGNIDVIVVKEGMPLPQVVEKNIDECCGIGYGSAVYINIDNISTKEEAVNLWIREVGAKEGLKTLIPDDIARTEFLGSVWDSARELSKNADNKEVCRIVADVQERYNNQIGNLSEDMNKCPGYAKTQLGEMFFGEFANSVDVKKELTHQEKSFWKDISEKVKNIIGKAFGIKGEKVLNQRDLAKVCACAVRAGEGQKSKIRLVLRDKINFRRKESERVGIEAAKKSLKI